MVQTVAKPGRVITVKLPLDMFERLDRLAADTGRAKGWYVREAIREHLGDMEDVYYAERRYEELRAGRTDTVTMSELERQLGNG